MAGQLPVLPEPPLGDRKIPPEKLAELRQTAANAQAKNTTRAYERGWQVFVEWCRAARRSFLPAAPETVLLFLQEKKATLGLPSLQHSVAAISQQHKCAGYDPPPTAHEAVRTIWCGIRWEKGTAPKNAKAPVTLTELVAMLAQVDRATLTGKRNAALLLVGFAAGLRRSELAARETEDIRSVPGGLSITIRRSKTDQEAQGQRVGIGAHEGTALCPVTALRDWIRAAEIRSGPLFRAFTMKGVVTPARIGDDVVGRIVKRYAEAAGLDPDKFAGHSLRAGLETEAYRQKIPEAQIMATTRHKSAAMLARYRREADPVREGVSGSLKLDRG